MKILLAITVLFLTTTFVFAQEWVLIGNTRGGDTFYLDKSSINKKDNLSTVNEKQVFKFSQFSQNGNLYDQTLLIKKYDCTNMNFTIIEAIGQDLNGNTIFKENFDKYYEGNPSKRWLKVGPESLFLKSYEIACK